MGIGAEEAHGDVLPGGALDAAGADEAGGIAINEQAEHHGGRVLGVAGAATVDLDVSERDRGDGLDHEVDEVVIGHPVAEIGREQQRAVAINVLEAGSRIPALPQELPRGQDDATGHAL